MTQLPIAANNKPENIEQNPPVMYNASVLYNPPTLGFYWGWCAYYIPEELDSMLREVGERTAEIALETFEVAIKAMGVHEPPEEQQYELLKAKPLPLWMEQRAKFPWAYEWDIAKFSRLQAKYGPEPAPTLPEVT